MTGPIIAVHHASRSWLKNLTDEAQGSRFLFGAKRGPSILTPRPCAEFFEAGQFVRTGLALDYRCFRACGCRLP